MDQTVVVKGKRTKRARPSSSSSSSHGVESGNNSQSQATSSTCTVTDQEDEDVANCLILLARGVVSSRSNQESHKASSIQRNPSRKFGEVMIYECKTCNRSFPSFQALGGHRASHKKPKTVSTENTKDNDIIDDDRLEDHVRKSYGDEHEMNDKPKVHSCSICGSEFGSGQALGGHMRRHRSAFKGNGTSLDTSVNDSSSHGLCEKPINNKYNNINNNGFSLDLNLPAPSGDEFYTSSKPVFSDAMESEVNCHY